MDEKNENDEMLEHPITKCWVTREKLEDEYRRTVYEKNFWLHEMAFLQDTRLKAHEGSAFETVADLTTRYWEAAWKHRLLGADADAISAVLHGVS